MSYKKRLDYAFKNAPVLPLHSHTKYVFFSDCHRGIGDNNDNFSKNAVIYHAALQYYYQYGFTYIEAGDGDELWENYCLKQIMEAHCDVFSKFSQFHKDKRFYMLYGNHDIIKRKLPPMFTDCCFHEGLILRSENPCISFRIAHGHQADFMNSVLWRFTRFLVRHLWAPLESFGISDPTSASKNNKKKSRIEKKFLTYAKERNCHLLAGHSHRALLGTTDSPYHNCGSCVFPNYITCIELCGYNISLVKWYCSAEKSPHFHNVYAQCPPTFPIYVKREVLSTSSLTQPPPQYQ